MTIKTTAQLIDEIQTNIVPNDTGAITPSVMQTTLIDIVNSYLNLPVAGTLAYQNAYAVSISGGAITGVSPLASSNVAITGGTITGVSISGVTLPWIDVTGTPTTLAGYGIPAYALTATNDTNVTISLGGSPSTALVAPASMTVGWSGLLSVPRGGTGAGTLTSNGVLYGNGALAVQSVTPNATGTNKFLTQVSGGVPAFSTIQASDLPASAVTPGPYTNANITVDIHGIVTAAANGSGGVTQVNTGTGLTGGPITGTGTIALANTAVTPGSYLSANLTVDQQGRITAAASGSGSGNTFASVASLTAGHPGDVPVVTVLGYSAQGDAGEPSTLFKQVPRAAANTVTDADGRHWAYVPNPSGFNPLWFGVVPDGVTNSFQLWYNALAALKLYGQSSNAIATLSASFTGSIVGTVLTASSVSGTIGLGSPLFDGNFTPPNVVQGTVIQRQITGSAGGAGTYQVSISQTTTSQGMQTGPAVTIITFTVVGGVLVCNWTGHKLRINDGFVPHAFYGALPTGVNEGQVYFVLLDSNFGPNTFAFSAVNNFTVGNNAYPAFVQGPGPAVTGSSGGSGNYTAWASGNEFIKVKIPPGVYNGNGGVGPIFGAGGKNIEVDAYGAVFNNSGMGTGNAAIALGPQTFTFGSSALIQTARAGDTVLTLKTIGDASKFWPGLWMCIGGLSLQDPYNQQSSWPPNLGFFEYVQIQSISGASITLTAPLRQNYLSTWPTFNPGPPTGFAVTGPAAIYGMAFNWDSFISISGPHFGDFFEVGAEGRSMRIKDTYYDGQGLTPSIVQSLHVINLNQPNVSIELDKLNDYVLFEDSTIFGVVAASQAANNQLVFKNCVVGILNGTPRQTRVVDSRFSQLYVGSGAGAFGFCDRGLLVDNSLVTGVFEVVPRLYDPGSFGAINNLLNNWVFSGGTIKYPIANIGSGGPNAWCVPSWKYFIGDYANQLSTGIPTNMGIPFSMWDIYQDGSGNFCADTSLSAMPTGNSTTATVTFSGTSVNWTSHGLKPVTTISSGTYNSATGIITLTMSGAIPFTWSKAAISGVTGTGTNLSSLNGTWTSLPTTSGTTATFQGPVGKGSITITGGSVTVAIPVTFLVLARNTGTLDTAVSNSNIYYVLPGGGNTTNAFQIATSPGGSAITFNGNGSGTQTGVSNPLQIVPHYCTKLTVLNSSGCPSVLDMNGAVAEPIYSRCRQAFSGYYDTFGYRSAILWGNLTSLIVNVRRADTSGFGTPYLLITCLGFDSSGVPSNFSQLIDLTTAGVRVITATGTTFNGSAGHGGSDNISAYTGWLSGQFSMTPVAFSNSGAYNTKPIIDLFAYTDQGITKDDIWSSYGALQPGNTATYFDTSASGGA